MWIKRGKTVCKYRGAKSFLKTLILVVLLNREGVRREVNIFPHFLKSQQLPRAFEDLKAKPGREMHCSLPPAPSPLSDFPPTLFNIFCLLPYYQHFRIFRLRLVTRGR